MAVKYSKCTNSLNSKALKIYPTLDFWFEKIPSGNPGALRQIKVLLHFLSNYSLQPTYRCLEAYRDFKPVNGSPGDFMFSGALSVL
jgi:hypothetical protein